MFRNNIMDASPDGLVFNDPHGACAVGIRPYSMRDVKSECPSEWHHHLTYLDCRNELKKTHDYYQKMQGAMAAVGLDWWDFVMWTQTNMKIQRIRRDHVWSMRYVPQPESFYKHHIVRKEDFDEDISDTPTMDSDEEHYEPYDFRPRDLTNIIHTLGPGAQYLRHMVTQCLHVHLARYIYQMQSKSRSGLNWKKAVYQF